MLKTFAKPVVLFTEGLSNEETELLGKILVAVKLKITDVEICSENEHLSAVKTAKNVAKIVVFGNFMGAKKMPETYKVLNVGTQRYLFSDTMSSINTNKNGEKVKLWESLKEMFL